MPNFIPRLKYAFFGLSLEAGTKAVAYLNIFTYSTMAGIFIINFWLEPIHPPPEEEDMGDYDAGYMAETWALGKNMRATFFLETTVIMQLVFATFLLSGAKLRHTKLLFSWILLQTGLIFHSQLTVILNFIVLVHGHHESITHLNIDRIWSFMFQEVTTIAFQFYCMLIVYHYHEQIKNSDLQAEQS